MNIPQELIDAVANECCGKSMGEPVEKACADCQKIAKDALEICWPEIERLQNVRNGLQRLVGDLQERLASRPEKPQL